MGKQILGFGPTDASTEAILAVIKIEKMSNKSTVTSFALRREGAISDHHSASVRPTNTSLLSRHDHARHTLNKIKTPTTKSSKWEAPVS